MQQVHAIESHQDKHEVEHVDEKAGGLDDVAAVTADGAGLLKSRFDEMSILKTLWVFRRVVLVTLAVYTGYMCEGFEVSEHKAVVADLSSERVVRSLRTVVSSRSLERVAAMETSETLTRLGVSRTGRGKTCKTWTDSSLVLERAAGWWRD